MNGRIVTHEAKRGKQAANAHLKKALAARALAAYILYASTRYVNTPVNTNNIPAPKGMPANIKTIQCTDGGDTKANQNKPMGTNIPPNIAGGNLNSGGASPAFLSINQAYIILHTG